MRQSGRQGICPGALEKIGEDPKYQGFYSLLRRVKPHRQQQIADLMSMSADRSLSFLTLLVAASRESDFLRKKTRTRGISRQQLATIEKAFRPLEESFRTRAPDYADNAYALVVTEAYFRRLLNSPRVANYLNLVHGGAFDGLVADGLVRQVSSNAPLATKASRHAARKL